MPDPRVTAPPVHRREELARAWTTSATTASYIPRPAAEVELVLRELVDELFEAVAAEDFALDTARRIGGRLVAEGLTDPVVLERTIDVLSSGLLGDLEPAPDTELASRVGRMLGALSVGFATNMRTHILDQQENVNQALLSAVGRAEHDLRATESRFHEVFSSSAIGIAITDLDGMCIEANPALGGILGTDSSRLSGRTLREMFLDEGIGDVMAAYERIRNGGPARVHERRKLRKDDGETAWALLAISLLPDGAGQPAYFVTMVQDVTELQLLQDRLSHQLLYDPLTGLPNRQCFHTNLESAIERAAPAGSVTLCCLNLDGFAIINNSLGHSTGDKLLQTVGRRLKVAVADERAVVARIGGDEFAVLIEDSPATPDIGELARRISAELSEPEYLDEHGVAVGASVGVVRSAAEQSATDLFRAADAALRKAKSTGRRQWAGFHDGDDGQAMDLDRLAAELPEAWENGTLAIAYEPVVRLADHVPVAARAVLTMTRPDAVPLGHDECMALAERTGLSVHLGPQILRESCAHLPLLLAALDPDCLNGVLRIELSRNQSGDADLIHAVNRAIRDCGLPATMLAVSLDIGAVLDDFGDARDNLEVLTEIGVRTGLSGMRGGPRELDLLSSVGVRSVTLAACDAGDDASSLLRNETARLVDTITGLGTECAVLAPAAKAEATWWAAAGATMAVGGFFGAPVAADEIPMLSRPAVPSQSQPVIGG